MALYPIKLHFLVLLLGGFLVCPELVISGHRINFAELFVYVLAFLHFNHFKNFSVPVLVKPFGYYLLFFLIAISISAVVNLQGLNGEGLFVFRQCLILILLAIILKKSMELSSASDIEISIKLLVLVLMLPSLVVFIQAYDIFGLKSIFDRLYSPIYFEESLEQRIGYRVTSVFKDSFMASVYLVVSFSAVLSFLVIHKWKRIDIYAFSFVLFLIFLSSFKVGRVPLIFIPFSAFLILIAYSRIIGLKRLIKHAFSLSAVILLSVVVFMLLVDANSETMEWVNELFLLLEGGENFSSYTVMHDMNESVGYFIIENLWVLFLPLNHTPHSYYEAHIYADNFYLQEVLRYGVYGISAIFLFVISFLKTSYTYKAKYSFVFLILMVVLNYKGGNTFFLVKASMIYPFVLMFSDYLEKFNECK